MKPTDTIVDEPVDDRRLDARATRPARHRRRGRPCARPSRARSTRSAPRSAPSSASATIADMARRFGISSTISTYPVDGARDQRRPPDRHDPRLRLGRQPRRRRSTPYAIRKVVTADGRLLYQHEPSEEPGAGRALGRGGNDRPAAVGGADRHRPRGADRPPGRRQDRHHQLQQGRLVHRLLERDHHRRVDGPRRRPAGRRPAGRHRARRAPSTTSCVVAVARRPVEQFETEVPMPDWQLEPEEEIWGLPPEELGLEPLVDADGNPLPPGDPAVDPAGRHPARRHRSRRRSGPTRSSGSGGQRAPQPQPQPQPQPPRGRSAAAAAALSARARSASAAARPVAAIAARGGDVAVEQLALERLELGAVVEVDADARPRARRRSGAPPAERGSAASCSGSAARPSSCPSACRRRRRVTERGDTPARGGELRRLARQSVERAALEEGLDAPRQSRSRGPPQRSSSPSQPRHARLRPAPTPAACRAPSIGIIAPGRERLGRKHVGELRVDPVALLGRPGERRAAAGPQRAGQLEHAAPLVEPQPQPPGAAHRRGSPPAPAGPGGRRAPQSGALDDMVFEFPRIDLADRPAARRLARLVDRLAASGDQIMPVAAAARRSARSR